MQKESVSLLHADAKQYQHNLTQSLFDLGYAIQKGEEKEKILNCLNTLNDCLDQFLLINNVQDIKEWFDLNDLEVKLLSLCYISQLEPDVISNFFQLSWYEQGPMLSLERMLLLCHNNIDSKEASIRFLLSESKLFRWQLIQRNDDKSSISLIHSYSLVKEVFYHFLPSSKREKETPFREKGANVSPHYIIAINTESNSVVSHCYSHLLKKEPKKLNIVEGDNKQDRHCFVSEVAVGKVERWYKIVEPENEIISPEQLITVFRYMLIIQEGDVCYLYWPNMVNYLERFGVYKNVIELIFSKKNIVIFCDSRKIELYDQESMVRVSNTFDTVLFSSLCLGNDDKYTYTLTSPNFDQIVYAWLSISRDLENQHKNKVIGLNDEKARLLATLYPLFPSAIVEIAESTKRVIYDLLVKEAQIDIFTTFQKLCLRFNSQTVGEIALLCKPRYSLRDMVLSENTLDQLKELIERVRYGEPLRRLIPNVLPGIQALLWGKPGTGKSMAGEAIAGELQLPLYKVNLSNVASKWIGETEKHLAKLFDDAESKNAVLLFDEADAIFAKRSEVESSHDKNANLGVSFLLQRMERYTGILLLSTNFKTNIDDAFLRRFHNVIEFPLPDVVERKKLWRNAWLGDIKLEHSIDIEALGQKFEFSPSQINNIIHRATLYAVSSNNTLISKVQLAKSIRRELEKQNAGYLADKKLNDWLNTIV